MCKLSEICDRVREKVDVSSLTVDSYISTENMLPNRGGITQSSCLPPTGKVSAFREGDVLVSNIRPYFKKIWYAKYHGGCSNDVLVFRAKEGICPRFLFYLLAGDAFFAYSMATSKGTKMPRGDISAIMEYEARLFPFAIQEKIAAILGALDDKLELNLGINRNLEEQAKAIYSRMFIEEAEDSWTVCALSDIADITMGQSPPGDTYNDMGEGTVFFQGRGEFGFRFPTRRLYTTAPKRMAQANDVLLSVRAPVGDVNVAFEPCCIGRGLGAIHSKSSHQSFLLYTILALRPKFRVFNGEGTVFGAINRDSLRAMEIRVPSAEKMDCFEKMVAPMDAFIRNNHGEICRLAALRDTLLPRLMSGELDVSECNI